MFGDAGVLLLINYGPTEAPMSDARKYGTTNHIAGKDY